MKREEFISIIKSLLLLVLFYWLLGQYMVKLNEFVFLYQEKSTRSGASFLQIVILTPFLEELIKWSWTYTRRFENKSIELVWILLVGYCFQVSETIYKAQTESDYWVRYLLASHLFFTFVARKYSFLGGFLLHSAWNTQGFFLLIPFEFTIALYWVVFLVMLINWIHKNKRINELDFYRGLIKKNFPFMLDQQDELKGEIPHINITSSTFDNEKIF